MKNHPPKLVNIVILVVDVVMEIVLQIVPAVTKEHIFMKDLVDLVHQLIMEMMMIGLVIHVTEPVAIVMDQILPIVLIVAMKPLDFTYPTNHLVYIHAQIANMPMQMEHVIIVTPAVQHALVVTTTNVLLVQTDTI
jgi:hypothetical protein